jgi:hypothetical protein
MDLRFLSTSEWWGWRLLVRIHWITRVIVVISPQKRGKKSAGIVQERPLTSPEQSLPLFSTFEIAV